MLKKEQNLQVNKNPYEDREGLVYVRVSSKKQEIEGNGLQSQEDRCVSDLKSIGVPHIKTFPDSFSGGGDFINRPSMGEMLGYIDTHPYKKFIVIFDDLSRFARDVQFHLKLRATFKARDVLLKCLNYNLDDSPEGMFAETVLAAGNELERHKNKRQVIQKMQARLNAGYWAFGVKRGYIMNKDSIHGKLCIPNGNEAKLLKEALEGFSNGVFIRKIDACKYLVEKGFWKLEPKKYVWLFEKMLKDPFYAGYIEYLKWDVARRLGQHKGIISNETFELNQKRLGKGTISKRIRTDVSSDLYLRGLLDCAYCGEHLSGGKTDGNGGIYWYYFCQNKSCELFRKSINRDLAHKEFKKLLIDQNLKPQTENLVTVIFDRVWKEEVKNQERIQKEKSLRQVSLDNKINQLTDMILNAKSEKIIQIYEKQIEKLAEELEETNKDIPFEEKDLNIPYTTALDKVYGLLKSPYKIWESVDTVEKHRLFFFLFEKKLPYSKKDGYTTSKIPCAIKLFEDFATTNTNDVDISSKTYNRLKSYLSQFWTYYNSSPVLQNMLINTA